MGFSGLSGVVMVVTGTVTRVCTGTVTLVKGKAPSSTGAVGLEGLETWKASSSTGAIELKELETSSSLKKNSTVSSEISISRPVLPWWLRVNEIHGIGDRRLNRRFNCS